MTKEVNLWHHFSIFDGVSKIVSGLLNIYGSRDKSDDVIYQHLLSRGIYGVSFCFIPCVEEISGGRGCTLQTSYCRLEYLFTCILGTSKSLFPCTLLSFSYHFYNIHQLFILYAGRLRKGLSAVTTNNNVLNEIIHYLANII